MALPVENFEYYGAEPEPEDEALIQSPARAFLAIFQVNDEPWRQRAACLGSNPDLFFPKRGENGNRAKSVCGTCPVKVECGDYADRTETEYGVWGQRTRKRGLKTK